MNKKKFPPDFELAEEETCRATIRMFVDFNLTSQFHIPYDVSGAHKAVGESDFPISSHRRPLRWINKQQTTNYFCYT